VRWDEKEWEKKKSRERGEENKMKRKEMCLIFLSLFSPLIFSSHTTNGGESLIGKIATRVNNLHNTCPQISCLKIWLCPTILKLWWERSEGRRDRERGRGDRREARRERRERRGERGGKRRERDTCSSLAS
jgi:hypothetical protein